MSSKKPDKTRKNFDTAYALDFLLKDIFEQIKEIASDQKDAPYLKLIELFFKGTDLRGKITPDNKSETPDIKCILGVDKEGI